jgi:IclR helix-turn-helix domain
MASAPAPTPALQALLDALAQRPDSTATEAAAAAGIGRSTAGKLLATLAAEGRVLRQPGVQQHGRRTPDRWTLITTRSPTATPPPGSPTSHATDAQRPGPARGRLGAGQLRDLVAATLAQQPGRPLSPTAIAKQLGRSAGAVANALGVLAGQGRVVQVQTSPRRYIAADASGSVGGSG